MPGVNYNPDVLSCLANLSNDEVFTPPEIANAMLDMLPQELFSDPNAKFLDPACKTGVFLREIAKRLIKGLENKIPNLQERLDHIFHEQLYAIAITELTALVSRRSTYCSKKADGLYSISTFDTPDGNIRYQRTEHKWDGNGRKDEQKCTICGASRSQFDRGKELETHAYEFIHKEDIYKMKFDLIISNPPYQISTGGGEDGAQAKPIYNLFVETATKLKPRYVSMIIPARWYSGGMGLNSFREAMLSDHRITKLVDFENSRDCFTGVDIASGVCYFLWERDKTSKCSITSWSDGKNLKSERYLDEFDVFIRNPIALEIVKKVLKRGDKVLSHIASSQQPFGIKSNVSFNKNGDIKIRTKDGIGPFSSSDVTKNKEWITLYKVITSKTSAEHAGMPDKNGQKKVLSIIETLNPGYICSESYRVMGTFKGKNEAINLENYLKTKFVRFLVSIRALSQNLSVSSFEFVPMLDYINSYSDEQLYKMYNFSEDEISFIEATIKPINSVGEKNA